MRELALHLWRAYDELHTSLRALGMAGKSSIADIIALLKREGRHYRLVQRTDSTIEIEALGAEGHAQAMEAVARIGEMHKEAMVQHLLAHPPVAPNPAAPLSLAAPAASVSLPALCRHRQQPRSRFVLPSAIRPWSLNGESLAAKAATRRSTRGAGHPVRNPAKTLVVKKMAVNDFVAVFGEMRPRPLSTESRISRGFWSGRRGSRSLIPRNDNPALGHVTYKAREKRLRKKHGFHVFNDAQLKLIFAPDSLKKLSVDARLGTWMGLYLGRRVSEIGQLAVSDFFDVDGIPCLRITDEGMEQSTKNDASNRIVPVHSELMCMGLLSRVGRLRKAGDRQIFPRTERVR